VLEATLSLVYCALCILLIYRAPFFRGLGIPASALSGVLIIKIACGVGLSFIYTYYYTDRSTADIYKYFDDSVILHNAFFDRPGDFFRMLTGVGDSSSYFVDTYYDQMNSWIRTYESNVYNDSHTMIRYNALLRFLSFGYFQVHTVITCFLSFIGLTAVYKSFLPFVGRKGWFLAAAIYLTPSILFWGSGASKEGLLLFALGLLIQKIISTNLPRQSVFYWLTLAISFGLLIVLKYYILMILIVTGGAYLWVRRTPGWAFAKYGTVFLFCSTMVVLLPTFFPAYNPLEILARKQADFVTHSAVVGSGSRIAVTPLEPTVWGFIKNIPEAVVNTLFRPFLWEVKSALMLPAAIENVGLMAIMLALFLFFRPSKIRWGNQLFFVFCFAFSVFVLVGWISPVLGASVRYKVPGLLLFMVGLVVLLDENKLTNRIPFFNKLLTKQ